MRENSGFQNCSIDLVNKIFHKRNLSISKDTLQINLVFSRLYMGHDNKATKTAHWGQIFYEDTFTN